MGGKGRGPSNHLAPVVVGMTTKGACIQWHFKKVESRVNNQRGETLISPDENWTWFSGNKPRLLVHMATGLHVMINMSA